MDDLPVRPLHLKAAAALLVVAAAAVTLGIPQSKASANCYNRQKICHGLPVQGCIGFTEYRENMVSQEKCDRVQEIESRCNSVGERICEKNNGSLEVRWSPEVRVFGLRCSKWEKEYSMELMRC